MTHVRFVEPASGYDVTMPSYQWGFAEGKEYLERVHGTTAAGVFYRTKIADIGGTPITVRTMRVLFENTDATIHQLRTLSWLALKNTAQVRFYPDADDPNTYWVVDWEQTTQIERVLDNHLTLEVVLIEHARAAA